MNLISKSMVKDTSKLFLDICKVTTTATFIMPYISGDIVKAETFNNMILISALLYIAAMTLNRLSDKMEDGE